MFRKTAQPRTDATPVRRRPSMDVSLTGLVYLSMLMFMGLAAINTQANLLFGVFGLMIGIVLISIWISGTVLRRIEMTRRLPDHAVVGEPTSVAYEFVNRKRFWPSVSVTVAELDGVEGFAKQPTGYLLHAAAGMTASVPVQLVPKRRGVHHLGKHQISTSFPFGFIKRAVDRDRADALLVYPPIGQVDPRLLQLARSAETSGPTVRPRRGGADEFYGLKEYREGENPRTIYWRRSARTGTLVSREMTHVSPPRLLLLVDTHNPDRTPARHADVEMCLAMAASLASFALESDLPVGIVAWTGEQFAVVEPQRGKRHRRDVLAMLATLPLNERRSRDELLAAAGDALDGGATRLLFTPAEDDGSGAPAGAAGSGSSGSGRIAGPSSMVMVQPHTPSGDRWFRFDPAIDFAHAMPIDQQPPVFAGRPPRAARPERRAPEKIRSQPGRVAP